MSSLEILDIPNLTEDDYDALHFAIQDMWATSLGELVACTECGHIASKKDIMGHLPREKYRKTVENILRSEPHVSTLCPECRGKTRYIYGEEHRKHLREKIKNSTFARIGVTRDTIGEITGMGFYYIDTFEKIFPSEFLDHYEKLGIVSMKEKIELILQRPIDQMIALSTIGFREGYKDLKAFFSFFENAFIGMPEKYRELAGITEIDANNRGMSQIFCPPWGKWCDIDTRLIERTHESYTSKVVVMEKPVEMFAHYSAGGFEKFVSGLIRGKSHP